ncbi:MAG: hypothetical protein PF572_02910 [Patescibacteria group bacterium]|jgi:hypothetical protein|nr:hypothetical protein [Patescibacteria group bacterium]
MDHKANPYIENPAKPSEDCHECSHLLAMKLMQDLKHFTPPEHRETLAQIFSLHCQTRHLLLQEKDMAIQLYNLSATR